MSKTNSKSSCELYRIWAAGDYAAISVIEWEDRDRGTFGGEILVHSSQGNFGGKFDSCAVPFKQFLHGLDMQNFLSKCRSRAHLAFDGEASVTQLGKAILVRRRARELSADDACALWGDLQFSRQSACRSERSFHITATRICMAAPILGDALDHVGQSASPAVRTFWQSLWPKFKARLNHLIEDRHPLAA